MDYFALNYYSTEYAVAAMPGNDTSRAPGVNLTTWRDGQPIGPVADSSWLNVVPWGLRKVRLPDARRPCGVRMAAPCCPPFLFRVHADPPRLGCMSRSVSARARPGCRGGVAPSRRRAWAMRAEAHHGCDGTA